MKYKEIWQNERPCPFDNPHSSDIITQNDSAYMTYALAPYHRDHLLVIPKRHVEHILDITHEEMEDIDALLEQGWRMMKKKMGYHNVSFLVREGKGSGASVAHMHYHIIPEAKIGDLEHDTENREILSKEEIKEQVNRMRVHTR
jgi:diadenosine tetraphosphate (Ap4A) HIT family hydrolase